MPVHRCPNCSLPYVDAEIEQGACPGCGAPLGTLTGSLRPDAPPPAPTAASGRRGAGPFLLGLFVGGLLGAGGLWAALRPGAPLPDGDEQKAAADELRQQKTAADNQAREAEAHRRATESARAEAEKARDAAKRERTSLSKQKDEMEKRLRDALARLAEERGRRVALEKARAGENKPKQAPTLSFVRDWQLLGPFPSPGLQAHEAVFPPEREPVQLQKPYDGFGGKVRWRPYRSPGDKIDLAHFFKYWQGGVAYAASWVWSDRDQAVTLSVGSDDGLRLWVNGAKVHDVKGGRQAKPGQDAVKVQLKKGWNAVLAKVDNIVGTWELYLEFRTADGREPLKIFSTSTPPPAAAP